MIFLLLISFVVGLLVLTYASAWLADLTGTFKTLYVKRPYRQLFQVVRWGVAGMLALVVTSILT